MEREEFVDKVVGNVPPFPDYYRRMKRLNADGPPPLLGRGQLAALDADAFAEHMERGHVVVDLREKENYGGAHVPGSYYVGHRPSMWGSWTVPYETPILLVARNREHAEEGRRALARVGLDDVRAYLKGGIDTWEESGRPVSWMAAIAPHDLASKLEAGEVKVLDVRGDEMWRAGAIEGALHVIAGRVQDHVADLPDGGQLAIVCNTGFQSTVAASVLERAGRAGLWNVAGGMAAWREAGLPTVDPEAAVAGASG
jgi:hydroxyacylglutathione hydrolase